LCCKLTSIKALIVQVADGETMTSLQCATTSNSQCRELVLRLMFLSWI
jgi:hypothetical protein